ncbi:MAG TPA: class I SAM-dependent methyltransferase [Steroidobacteraceae bacterium]|nr:class I SAM-dependent methyltransferase [Steroidobacteraceae bacterium]
MNPSLIDRASEPYRSAGLFAYNFARSKLSSDPVFRAMLERGLLLGRGHILDLGCGQGLLASWLRAALLCYESGSWPQGWPPAPTPRSTRGIELMVRDVERARAALGPSCDISQGDIRSAEFGTTDAVVILDVLHYMTREEQLQVLKRVRAALPAHGLLLLRIGDADGGLRFRYSQCVDKLVMIFRGQPFVNTHCRSAAQWRELLRECGFEVQATPMSEGTRFANVLLIGHAQ